MTRSAGGKQPISVRFSPDGQLIAVVFNKSTVVNVLNGEDLSLLYTPDTPWGGGVITKITWSQDGAWLYSAGTNRRDQFYIRRWSVNEPQSGAFADNPIRDAEDWPVVGNLIISDITPLSDGRLTGSYKAAIHQQFHGVGERPHWPIM